MTRNGQFCPICNFSNLFPPKWLRMTRNGQFCPIHNFSNLFPLKWLRMTQNSQFHLICKFSNLFPPKWLRMTRNGQFCLICNFSNLFPLKWLRMTQNSQLCPIRNFSIFSHRSDSEWPILHGQNKIHTDTREIYERLLFYMDSCALSPMASLLYTYIHTHIHCYGFILYDWTASLTNRSARHTIGVPPEHQYRTVKDV